MIDIINAWKNDIALCMVVATLLMLLVIPKEIAFKWCSKDWVIHMLIVKIESQG
jgi:hypothetical protein